MAFQFEGNCCELVGARISAAKYEEVFNGLATPFALGNILKFDATPQIKEISVPNKQDGSGGTACSTKQIEKIEISMTIQCQKSINKEYFLGAGRNNTAASTAGAPKTWWLYMPKPSSLAGETRLVSLPFAIDAKASGADAFKIEGYAVAATPVIWNKLANTTTPASPVVTALVSGVDYTPVYSADGTLITAVEIFMSSTKFSAFTTFIAGAVNLKFSGKTFDQVEFSPFNNSKVELYLAWSGENYAESKNYFNAGAFFRVSFDVGGLKIIDDGDNMATMEVKGTALNTPTFQYQRPDLVGGSTLIKNIGFLVNQTS